MSIINPWVTIFEATTAGQTWVTHDWQANKEYMVYTTDYEGNNEINIIHLRIPFDIPAPTSGVSGMRTSGGYDVGAIAEVSSTGIKRFKLSTWGSSEVNVILKIMERSISPDPSDWSLDPADDTYEMVEFVNTGTVRERQVTDFQRDYEYLLVFYAPESSSQKYYACSTFYNLQNLYAFSNGTRRGFLYWHYKNTAVLGNTGTSGNLYMKGGPSTHLLHKVYRRKVNYDVSKKFYNTLPKVATFNKQKGIFTRFLDYNKDYIFGGLDYGGDNEYVTGMMRYDQYLEKFLDSKSGVGFITRALDNFKMQYDSRISRFEMIGKGELYFIHERLAVEEYTEVVDPGPDPDPVIIDCENQCLAVGQKYISEVSIETIFNDPPDWAKRSYEYQWSTDSSELTISSTEQNGRVAIVRLEHVMRLEDDGAFLPYNLNLVVKDLQYETAGVQDIDSAVLTFEMPCLTVDNETNFSIDDISIAECGPGDTDTVATFTVTSDVAIEGTDVTVDYAITGVDATSGDDYVDQSGTLTFSAGDTTKTIDISILCDNVPEFDETFNVVLSNLSRGTLTKATGVGTIVDDSPNEVIVELADAGSQYQNYILRDISGSMSGTDVTLNGQSSTRDTIAISILNNYNIPSSDVLGAVGASVTTFATALRRHVLDNVPPTQKNISVFFVTDSTDGYGTSSAAFKTYTSASNNHPTWNDTNHVATTLSPDVVVSAGDTWSDVMGTFPSTIEDMKITVVRLVGSDAASSQGSLDAVQGYNDLFINMPPEITEASMETFDDYTPGEPGPLNDRIDASVLSTYNAYCSKDPGNVIQVQASSQAEAQSLAESQLNCA